MRIGSATGAGAGRRDQGFDIGGDLHSGPLEGFEAGQDLLVVLLEVVQPGLGLVGCLLLGSLEFVLLSIRLLALVPDQWLAQAGVSVLCLRGAPSRSLGQALALVCQRLLMRLLLRLLSRLELELGFLECPLTPAAAREIAGIRFLAIGQQQLQAVLRLSDVLGYLLWTQSHWLGRRLSGNR